MGYNTRYMLTQERNPISDMKLAALIAANEEAQYTLLPDGQSSGEGGRWYEHEKDLRAWSKEHPTVLFKLHGEGEDNGDIWDKYFTGGNMVHEVKVSTELPKPDYDALVADAGNTLRTFAMDVPIIAKAYTAAEAHEIILSILVTAKVDFDSTCIGDAEAVPLD